MMDKENVPQEPEKTEASEEPELSEDLELSDEQVDAIKGGEEV